MTKKRKQCHSLSRTEVIIIMYRSLNNLLVTYNLNAITEYTFLQFFQQVLVHSYHFVGFPLVHSMWHYQRKSKTSTFLVDNGCDH